MIKIKNKKDKINNSSHLETLVNINSTSNLWDIIVNL